MTSKEMLKFFERRKNRLLKKGYPFFMAFGMANEQALNRFIIKPVIDIMKKFYWKTFARQIKAIIDGRDAHLDHHQTNHQDE